MTCSDLSAQKHPQQYGSLFTWADPLVGLTDKKHALLDIINIFKQSLIPLATSGLIIFTTITRKAELNQARFRRALRLLLNENASLSFVSSCKSFVAFTNKQQFSHGIRAGPHPSWTTSLSL